MEKKFTVIIPLIEGKLIPIAAETVKSIIPDDSIECVVATTEALKGILPMDIINNSDNIVIGNFKNRAAAFNTAIRESNGKYIIPVDIAQGPVIFAKSSFDVYEMAMERNPDKKPGLIYADYQIIAPDGTTKDIGLLEWHIGRVRDMWDTGSVFCCPRSVIEVVGGFEEKYNAADWYDLRNKISAKYPLVHISNRFNGALYKVKKNAETNNVFAYLLKEKWVQLEMEDACTQHLKRIGAYLAPGQNIRAVEYTPEEESKFQECIASIIIPVFNRPEFIGDAIDSIQAQKTDKKIEVIIVVNGGETDPTIPAVKEYMEGGSKYDPNKPLVRLIVVDINNLGLCFNKGLQIARGKFYVQLDSDDRLTEDAVEKILAVYESDPKIGMVVGSYEVWVKQKNGSIVRNEEVQVITHDEWTEKNGRNNLLRINGAGAPRSAYIKVIKEAGWFGVNDTPYCRNYGEDYDLVGRIAEKWKIGRVWDPIYKVVRHSGGTDHLIDEITINRNDNAKDEMRKEAIKRRQKINQKKD